MKCLTATILSFIVIAFAKAQDSEGVPLNFMSHALKLNVTKDGALILNTRVGEVGITSSLKEKWRRADPVRDNNNIGPTIDQANFFNKDTGFVSGFISGKTGKYNVIYHTTDGGRKWKTVNFGQDGWVDDAINLSNGEAWLSVAGSGIAYTTDYGLTWQKMDLPEPKQRFSSIYFNTHRQGIIGSLWNLIAITDNNCKTWTFLPTPLDQKKYSKGNPGSRPAISRIAIFKDYLLVLQEDLVFFSKKDSVNWRWLPEYNDFYTDPENSALFFKTTKGTIIRANLTLQPIFTSEKIDKLYDARCSNGGIYIVCSNRLVHIKPDNTVLATGFNTNVSSGFEPQSIGYNSTGQYGIQENKVYLQKGNQGKWEFLFSLPFSSNTGSYSVIDGNLLLFDRTDDSLFYYSLSGKEVAKKSKSILLKDFCKEGVIKIVFSRGSHGCFHNYADHLIYTNNNGIFDGEIGISSTSNKEVLPENDMEIDQRTVLEFVTKIPLLFDSTQNASISDLMFTEREYKQCKEDILTFQKAVTNGKKYKENGFSFNKNNIDFVRLLALVDSIRYIDKSTLTNILLSTDGSWSTTTNWTKIELVNNQNKTLSITSSYYQPNAFYFPWQISLDGYSKASTSMEINNFINIVYPALLKTNERVKILHTIVKQLYSK